MVLLIAVNGRERRREMRIATMDLFFADMRDVAIMVIVKSNVSSAMLYQEKFRF